MEHRKVEGSATTLPVRVFLVEDSVILRERLTERFTVPGRIEVIGHADGEAVAVEALRRGDWEVLVLDLQLKEGSGFGVLRALKHDGRPAGAQIIVLTSFANAYYRAKSEQLGANHFFDKARDHQRVFEVLEGLADDRA